MHFSPLLLTLLLEATSGQVVNQPIPSSQITATPALAVPTCQNATGPLSGAACPIRTTFINGDVYDYQTPFLVYDANGGMNLSMNYCSPEHCAKYCDSAPGKSCMGFNFELGECYCYRLMAPPIYSYPTGGWIYPTAFVRVAGINGYTGPPEIPTPTPTPTATGFNWPCTVTADGPEGSCTATNQAGVLLARRPGTVWDGWGWWDRTVKNFWDCAEICTGPCQAVDFFESTPAATQWGCYVITSNYFYQDYWFSRTDWSRDDITAVTVVPTDTAVLYGGAIAGGVASMWPRRVSVIASSLSDGVGGVLSTGAVPGSLPTMAASVATDSGLVSTSLSLSASIALGAPQSSSTGIGAGSLSEVQSSPSPQVFASDQAAIESALSALAASARSSSYASSELDGAPSSTSSLGSVASTLSTSNLVSAPQPAIVSPGDEAAIESALSLLAASARGSSDISSSTIGLASVSTVPGSVVSTPGSPSIASSPQPANLSSAAASILPSSSAAATQSSPGPSSSTQALSPLAPPVRLVFPIGIIFPGITLTKPSLGIPGVSVTPPAWVIIPPSPTPSVALPFGTSSALLPALTAAPTACPSANGAITSMNGRQFQITCNAAHCGATSTYTGTGAAVTNLASCIGQCTGSCTALYYTSGWCMQIVGGGSKCPYAMAGYTAVYPVTSSVAAMATSSVLPACGNGLLGLGLLCVL